MNVGRIGVVDRAPIDPARRYGGAGVEIFEKVRGGRAGGENNRPRIDEKCAEK